MKSLVSFIKESTKENKPSNKYYTLSFSGIDGGAECVSKIVKLCEYNAINKLTADNGSTVKIEVSDSKFDAIKKIIDTVNDFISSIPNDKHDDIAEQLDKLSSQVEKIEDAVKPDDEPEEQPTEEPKEKKEKEEGE